MKNTRKWNFRIYPAKIALWIMTIQVVRVAGSKFDMVTSCAQNCEISKKSVIDMLILHSVPIV